MKTIQQAASEYAEKERTTRSEHTAFVDGVEFAQRWISVDEELPEQTMETMQSGNYIYIVDPVLVKTLNGKYTLAKRSMFLDHGWNWMGSSDFNKSVTHWRPIELK